MAERFPFSYPQEIRGDLPARRDSIQFLIFLHPGALNLAAFAALVSSDVPRASHELRQRS